MQEERVLHQVAKQTKDYATKISRDVATFVYRDAQCADMEYVLAAGIVNDTQKDHWWLQQNGTICTRDGIVPDGAGRSLLFWGLDQLVRRGLVIPPAIRLE